MHARTHFLGRRVMPLVAAAVGGALLISTAGVSSAAASGGERRGRQAAELDASHLRLAAAAVQAQALATGALSHKIKNPSPAVVLFRADQALLAAAVRRDPRRVPVDTRVVMGLVPYNLAHLERHRPGHRRWGHTRALGRYRRAVAVGGSVGLGTSRSHDGARVAPYQKPDGVYVEPRLPRLSAHATVSEASLRAAVRQLGKPYVWGGAGPSTFDCSGLVRHAYARAGVRLNHFSGDQWNEGRLIPARDALPGDLIMFGNPIFHVAMYLGGGWMLNAPFTGHYVDVQPVWHGVAGVVRP